MAKQQKAKPIQRSGLPQNSQAATSDKQWLTYTLIAAVLAFTLVLYWPSLQNGFTNWDDDVYVTSNEDLAFTLDKLKVLITKQVAGNFHPLTMWSLAWDKGSSVQQQPDPLPFHRSNLLLHLLNTVLVFGLARRLKANIWVAAVAALFFAIHPMHVESVAWVSGRKDLLFSAFFLGGLITFTHFLEHAKAKWLVLAFGLFVLACLSKPAAIVFPLCAWLIQWYLQPTAAWNRQNLWYWAPFLLVSVIFSYTTLVYQQDIGALDQQFGWGHKSLFASYAFVTYLWKLALPIHLSAFHPAPLANASLAWHFYAAAPAALALVGLMWYSFSRHRTLFFALAFYLANLILVLGFIKIGSAVMAERYTYISYTGLFLAIGWVAWRLWEQGGVARMAAWAIPLLLTGYWAWACRQQILVWQDSETLWTQIIAEYPTEANYSYRGYHRYLEQNWDKALEDFDRAYALNPNNPTTIHIRAICLEKSGETEAALEAYSAFEQKFPPKADVYFQHANLLNALKKTAAAIPCFEKGLALSPQNIDGWTNLSTAYFAEKQPEKAIECCNKVLEINPKFLIALNNRGALHLSLGQYEAAIADLSASLTINSEQPQAYQYRSLCYERTGQLEAAKKDKEAMAKLSH